MATLKKTIETQRVINEAVEAIFKYFDTETSYAESLETISDAQIEIMEMMEMNRTIAACPSLGIETIPTTDINTFLYQVNQVYRLLRPFAKLMGQVYGNEG